MSRHDLMYHSRHILCLFSKPLRKKLKLKSTAEYRFLFPSLIRPESIMFWSNYCSGHAQITLH